jgi:hypothetical protein
MLRVGYLEVPEKLLSDGSQTINTIFWLSALFDRLGIDRPLNFREGRAQYRDHLL